MTTQADSLSEELTLTIQWEAQLFLHVGGVNMKLELLYESPSVLFC